MLSALYISETRSETREMQEVGTKVFLRCWKFSGSIVTVVRLKSALILPSS